MPQSSLFLELSFAPVLGYFYVFERPYSSAGFWPQDPYLRFICKIFISQIFISKIFISKVFISEISISRILYLGYHIYEINISDLTRYLCRFVG